MTAGIGHNQGPTMELGHRWRTYQWRRAQKALMPNTIPLTIVRMRMRRATELGMDYKTYATVRQSAGRDILAMLFSSNALRIIGGATQMPTPRREHLEQVKGADHLALVHRPTSAQEVLHRNPVLTDAETAPHFAQSWSEIRGRLERFLQRQPVAAGQVLIVGDTTLEAEWLTAARAGAYLPSEHYFTTVS